MTTLRIEIPKKLRKVFSKPRGSLRYRVMRGGRGSGKSFNAAKMAAIWGAIEPLRILCARDLQNSIKESFHAELKSAIASEPWLSEQYDVGIDYLRHRSNGTEFLFKGLRHNIASIKSTAQIDLCIVEEAEDVGNQSWVDLIPTIRAPGSEFWIIYNPRSRDSWVAQQFDGDTLPPRSMVVTVNHDDNPWFSEELEEQRRYDQETMDPALYAHVWEGEYYEQSDAQVFAGKYRVSEFDPKPEWSGPYYGLDFGFSQDPTAATCSWVHDNVLYIGHELFERGLELDATASALIDALPGIEKHTCRADSSRPESISYLRRHGIPRVEACKKGAGSVEDGVEFIKSFREVVIHPRCKGTAEEFRLYSYKIDRLSGDILPVIIDSHNHGIDSLRYALEPIMRSKKGLWG